MIWKSDDWVALCYTHFFSERGTVGAAWVQYRAFPQELRPEAEVVGSAG